MLAERTEAQRAVQDTLSAALSQSHAEAESQLERNLILEEDDGNDNPSDLLDADYPVPPEHGFQVHTIPFSYLKKITGHFAKNGDRSRFIGVGGFAEVYLGVTSSGRQLAIKKLKPDPADPNAQFLLDSEVGEVTQLIHPHIIRILGFSNDTPDNACLIYPYMVNGNLEEALSSGTKAQALDCPKRLSILIGVAEAIHFLHSRPKALIHRDIKTSNILLDEHMQPKV